LKPVKPRFAPPYYVDGIRQGSRVVLGQAITLIESSLPNDQAQAHEVLEKILPYTGRSMRIGITGVPGVGKSTFIEALGLHVVGHGKKIAVLSVDPTSPITKGSILGDKTRMEELSKNTNAFIRPTASGQTLGGVASRTREAMLLCEAAGYDVIFVETIGVGQSEIAVKNMVDFFLLLMLAGAGDELQGIKKGIMEMADAVVITKADGDNVKNATHAQAEYQHAFHLFSDSASGWKPRVLTSSAITGEGIPDIWKLILEFSTDLSRSGFFEMNRRHQNVHWFEQNFEHLLRSEIQNRKTLQKKMESLRAEVRDQKISSAAAALKLLEFYRQALSS
jgi:LAO/AO transport system kinase